MLNVANITLKLTFFLTFHLSSRICRSPCFFHLTHAQNPHRPVQVWTFACHSKEQPTLRVGINGLSSTCDSHIISDMRVVHLVVHIIVQLVIVPPCVMAVAPLSHALPCSLCTSLLNCMLTHWLD